jgi:hypothetical protein
MPNPVWQYGLFVSRELDTNLGRNFCYGAGQEQATDCSQADPKPGKGPPFAKENRHRSDKTVMVANLKKHRCEVPSAIY